MAIRAIGKILQLLVAINPLVFLLLALLGAQPAFALDKWGFIDREGNFVIALQFGAAAEFHNGLAKVRALDPENHFKEDKWQIDNYEIEKDGSRSKNSKALFPKRFEIKKNGYAHKVFGFVDNAGNLVIQPEFEYTMLFDQDWEVAGVKRLGADHWDMIDRQGNEIAALPPDVNFEFNDSWKDGLLTAKKFEGKVLEGGHLVYFAFNKKGDRVDYNPFLGEDLIVQFREEDGGFNYLDNTGKIAIELSDKEVCQASPFHEGLAAVGLGEVAKTLLRTPDGRLVPDPHPRILPNRDAKLGFIDKTGKIILRTEYPYFDRDPRMIAGGLIPVLAKCSTGNLYGYIDRSGKMVIAPSFTRAHSFSEGLAAVCVSSGATIIPASKARNKIMLPADQNGSCGN